VLNAASSATLQTLRVGKFWTQATSAFNGQANGATGGLQVRQQVGVLCGGKIPQDGRVETALAQVAIAALEQVGPFGRPFKGMQVGQPVVGDLIGTSATAHILIVSGNTEHVTGVIGGIVVFGLQLKQQVVVLKVGTTPSGHAVNAAALV